MSTMNGEKPKEMKRIATFEAREKVVSTCLFRDLYMIATEHGIYAYGEKKTIQKVFPHWSTGGKVQ